MPIPATAKWPKPRSEDEFEDICVDFLRRRWKDPNAMRNGRRGQRQDGVDIAGRPERFKGKVAGAQCKNTDALKLCDVVADAKKAERFVGGLVEFLVVTSGDRDASLQAEIRRHFKTTPAPFSVDIVFWEDVVAELSADENIVVKYWKGFIASLPALPMSDAQILASMEPVFDRPAFTTPFRGESSLPGFKQALTDTIMSLNTGIRRTREGIELERIPSRYQVNDPIVRSGLSELERSLTILRSTYDDLIRDGDIKPCPCGLPECPVFELSSKAIRDMDQQRQSVLDLFRRLHPSFDARVG